jgi:hypothetical protein
MICKRCSSGSATRRDLKSAIKEAGRKRELRVVACGCLDVCPKRGSAAMIVACDRPARCVVIPDSAGADAALIETLLDQRVGDPVTS